MSLMNHIIVIWFVFFKGIAWGRPSALHFRPFFLSLLDVHVCVCVCVFPWASRCLRYQSLAWSVFHSEQFRPSQLCGTCIWKGRKMFYISRTKQGSPVPFFFHIQAWASNSSYFSSSCFNLCVCVCVCSLCRWILLLATLTLGVLMEERRGWYPDVNVCFCLGSSKEPLYVCVCVCTQHSLSVWFRTDCDAWSRKNLSIITSGAIKCAPKRLTRSLIDGAKGKEDLPHFVTLTFWGWSNFSTLEQVTP